LLNKAWANYNFGEYSMFCGSSKKYENEIASLKDEISNLNKATAALKAEHANCQAKFEEYESGTIKQLK
jgi:peptidoglycan hydrolase CwlO-like protein